MHFDTFPWLLIAAIALGVLILAVFLLRRKVLPKRVHLVNEGIYENGVQLHSSVDATYKGNRKEGRIIIRVGQPFNNAPIIRVTLRPVEPFLTYLKKKWMGRNDHIVKVRSVYLDPLVQGLSLDDIRYNNPNHPGAGITYSANQQGNVPLRVQGSLSFQINMTDAQGISLYHITGELRFR